MAIREPIKYLRAYIRDNFQFEKVQVYSEHPNYIYADCTITRGKNIISIRLLLPKSAPRGARPLLASVSIDDKLVWSYKEHFLTEVQWGDIETRIHLHEVAGMFMQVHVREGDPGTVVRVSRLTDVSLSDMVEVHAKVMIATKWGLKKKLTRAERQLLKNSTP